jgi:uncharacterized protein YecT (DUF1311 family)
MIRHARFGLVIFCFAMGAARAAQPSFDCARASGAAEKAICADPKLAALDVAIAKTYGRLRSELDRAAAAALKEDQRAFIALRDRAREVVPDDDMRTRLAERLKFLEGIGTRPAGTFLGVWRNEFGTVRIRSSGAALNVDIDTADPAWGRWVCETGGEGTVKNGALEFGTSEDAGDRSSIAASRKGMLLLVEAHVGPGGAGLQPDYCGHNGSVDGKYFPVTGAAATE